MALTEEFRIVSDYRDSESGLDELALSIQADGLYQPIIVTPSEEGGYEIVAGRRRFRAITEYLGWKTIKKNEHYIIKYGIDVLVAQFQENFNRKDFTPGEMSRLIKDIHDSKVKEHGPSVKGHKGGWGLKDTGKLIGRDSGFISRMLTIAENEKEVAECQTVSEALEVVEKKKNRNLQKKVQKHRYATQENAASSSLEELISQTKQTNAKSYLSSFEDNFFEFICLDPPYGINYQNITHPISHDAYEDDPEDFKELMETCIPEYYRVLKEGRYCVIWTAVEHFNFICELMAKAGFKVSRTPLYWIKLNSSGRSMNPNKTAGNQVEIAPYGWKGDGQLVKPGSGNAFPVPIVRGKRIHVAQKPEELYEKILQIFTRKNDKVLDTFCGSMSILRACYKLERNFFGCEKIEESYITGINYTRHWETQNDKMDSEREE